MTDYLPVIDLADAFAGDDAALRRAAARVDAVCRQHGFFYITGHGVPPGQVQAMFAASKRLFDLPQQTKCKFEVGRSPIRRGYDPMGRQRLDAGRPADLKEGFGMGPRFGAGAAPTAFRGPNQWPEEHELPGFRTTAEEYFDSMQALGRSMMGLLAVALGLPRGHFAAAMDVPSSGLKLLHYPPQPERRDVDQLAAGAHTDWQAITLLAQDDCGGLQVGDANGGWHDVPPVAGSFVVNLGDLMARWTNDRYRSTMHRVVHADSRRHRYSMAFFVEVDYDTLIEPLPGCADALNPPRYASVTAGDHLREMYARSRVVPASAT